MRRVNTLKRSIIAVTVSILVGSYSLVSAAASSPPPVANGFQISPLLTTLTIAKGQSQIVDIYLTNPTDDVSTAQAIVNNFVASSEENGTPRLLLNATPIPQNNFKILVGSISNVVIQPGQQVVIPVKLSVPQYASAGDYYGAIRFEPLTIGKSSTVGLTASVGSLFLITVPGNLVQRVTLIQLSAAQNGNATSFITSGQVQIISRLDNVGQVHEQPFGRINIKNMFGKEVASVELNNTNPRANILADSIRKFINNVPNKSWFGYYTVEANFAYQQGSGNIITATTNFWYLPVWYLIPIVALIVIIIVLIYQRKHRKIKSTSRFR